jgi:phosphate transport system protein
MATHLETELKILRANIIELWELVILQTQKAKEAVLNFDKDLATEVKVNEKRVNALELNIDKECEDILALHNPVAVDLRFVLAVLKINYNLERIGDYAKGVASQIINLEKPLNPALVKEARLEEMFTNCIDMLTQAMESLDHENNKQARAIFQKDEMLDEINRSADKMIMDHVKAHPGEFEQSLRILKIILKLERVGDQTKNMAEEIIFYIEAKVLRHNMKKLKSGK